MPLAPGTKLGPYEILSPLGSGGMGEVYCAHDGRLGRDVAIKILPEHLSADPSAKARFEREARAISGLNHPNICALYDVGSQDSIGYIVMELIDGQTLAERLKKGALPLEQALKIGREMADALDQAHKRGIIHRDVKPGNIILTKSGGKLLDFGLARPAPAAATVATMTQATSTLPLTQEGSIVGTFQYMSPEQVEGKELDARSDIFSLGAVIYEMMTGRRAFEGKTQLSVASAILEKDPEPLSQLLPLSPPALGHTVQRCLAKDPDNRWQTARDLAGELAWVAQTSGTSRAVSIPTERIAKKMPAFAWVLIGLLTAALFAVWWWKPGPPEKEMHFSAALPFAARDLAIAPNGHTIAIVGYRESTRKNTLWLYELGAADARPLADTEGASFPFWSADGQSVGFFAEGKLKKTDISGGPVQSLCDAPTGRGGSWNKDGVILFTPTGQLGTGLFKISASGGTPVQITFPDRQAGEDSHRWPVFLPDGDHFLYLAVNFSGRKDLYGIYVGSLNSPKEKHFINRGTANAAYTEPGYLLFYSDQTLFAQRFDLRKFTLSGQPTAILTDLQFAPRIGHAVFSVYGEGLLVTQKLSGELSMSQPVWFDRTGKQIGAFGKLDIYGNIQLAPDGKFIAADRTDIATQNTDIWTYALDRDAPNRRTFDPGIDSTPIWSPDSSKLIFSSNRHLKFDLFIKDASGAKEETLVIGDGPDKYAYDWSRDGKYVLYASGQDLWYATYPDFKTTMFLKAPSSLKTAQFSPDGRWVAYSSNETGKWEIYVTAFPGGQGKWQVSNGGGTQPRWRGDGKELFYLSPDYKIMAIPVTSGATFDAGAPTVLFQTNPRELVATSEQISYDVSHDGQKFLVNTQAAQAEAQPMSVLLNWAAKLGK